MTRPESPRTQLMREMRIVGHTLSDVAKIFDVTKQYVSLVAGKVVYDRLCKYCGSPFRTATANSYFCSGHGNQYRRHGRKRSQLERIRSRILKLPNGCHEWGGSTDLIGGYGYTSWLGRRISCHRWAWEQAFGKIPDGLWVLHKCDNCKCMNPDHLFLGTAADNAKDRDTKGRHQTHVLSESQIREIKSSYKSIRDAEGLGEKFSVHPATIYKIARERTHKAGKVWKRGRKRILGLSQSSRIRDLYAHGNHTMRSLAMMYHISHFTIFGIVNDRNNPCE